MIYPNTQIQVCYWTADDLNKTEWVRNENTVHQKLDKVEAFGMVLFCNNIVIKKNISLSCLVVSMGLCILILLIT